LIAIATGLGISSVRGADLQVPQQFAITLADGQLSTAILAAGPQDSVLLLIQQPDGTAIVRYLCKAPVVPTPGPTPTPVIEPTRLQIAIVADPVATTPQQATVILSKQFHDAAKAAHVDLGVVSPTVKDSVTGEVPPAVAPFLKAASGKPLPWAMFANTSGSIIWQGQPPATESEFLALLKKYGG